MAQMEAIERAASAPQKPPMGGMPMGGAPDGPKGPETGSGVDALVDNLSAVGEFLKAQGDNPASQEAMQHLQALIQSLMSLSGGGPDGGTQPGMMPENPGQPPKIM